MKVKTRISLTAIESRAIRHLKKCWLNGQYTTERATDFWSVCEPSENPCLSGERKIFGSDLICQPIKFNGRSLLVSLTDTKGKSWFSWIHA